MANYDKLKKKYDIGLVMEFLILPAALYGKSQSGWMLFLVVLLIFVLGIGGLLLMLPHERSIEKRKPPFSR